jgi:uncharacterized coiled-coil protein SlyX
MGLRDTVGRLRRLQELEARIAELEDEVQECRQVNLRLAELTDVVAELLLPVAQRNEARIDEVLRRYHDSVGVPPS